MATVHGTPQPLTSQWRFWMLVAIAFFLAIDIASDLSGFPIRLVLLQVEVWLAEATWARYDPNWRTQEQRVLGI